LKVFSRPRFFTTDNKSGHGSDEARGERRTAMFVNCYDGYGLCLFSVRIKEGVMADSLGDHIYSLNDLIDSWCVANEPHGAVVRY
jgi:hypothetical protein